MNRVLLLSLMLGLIAAVMAQYDPSIEEKCNRLFESCKRTACCKTKDQFLDHAVFREKLDCCDGPDYKQNKPYYPFYNRRYKPYAGGK